MIYDSHHKLRGSRHLSRKFVVLPCITLTEICWHSKQFSSFIPRLSSQTWKVGWDWLSEFVISTSGTGSWPVTNQLMKQTHRGGGGGSDWRGVLTTMPTTNLRRCFAKGRYKISRTAFIEGFEPLQSARSPSVNIINFPLVFA